MRGGEGGAGRWWRRPAAHVAAGKRGGAAGAVAGRRRPRRSPTPLPPPLCATRPHPSSTPFSLSYDKADPAATAAALHDLGLRFSKDDPHVLRKMAFGMFDTRTSFK